MRPGSNKEEFRCLLKLKKKVWQKRPNLPQNKPIGSFSGTLLFLKGLICSALEFHEVWRET